uniref:Uncharacterized protein n=1 Tax=Ascaris lumbricoides TaxID=6252 RepID=A0A0M3HP55_ASCLU
MKHFIANIIIQRNEALLGRINSCTIGEFSSL